MANEVILEGTVVRVKTTSPLTSIGGTAVTPDKWVIEVRSPDSNVSAYTYTNGSGDPSNMIFVPSTGNVYIDIDTTNNVGLWKVIVKALPRSGGSDTTKTKAVYDFVFHVSPLPFLDIA
jgi:hypothetical protein